MGKKKSGSSSWMNIVKRAFRSVLKDTSSNDDKRRDEDEEKREEKRRWLFRKKSAEAKREMKDRAVEIGIPVPAGKVIAHPNTQSPGGLSKEDYAAQVIQSAYRGYLARRHKVRKQAQLTLQYMQALVCAQDRVKDQRARLSHDVACRKSMLPGSTDPWKSSYLRDIRERRSTEKERQSTVKRDTIIPVAEIDTFLPYASYSRNPPWNYARRSLHHSRRHPNTVSSPLRRPNLPAVNSTITPSPSKTRPIQVRSASPRIHSGNDQCYSSTNTPSLSLAAFCTTYHNNANTVGSTLTMTPRYMAATESARARSRSRSAPRQRALTPDWDSGGFTAKKQLSYAEQQHQHQPSHNRGNLRSPRLNVPCYAESIIGEVISPCSTTDLRWLR